MRVGWQEEQPVMSLFGDDSGAVGRHDGTMKCRCGTPSCRGTIGGRDWQRPDLQRWYGRYFSSYLLRRLPRQPDQRP